MLSALDELSKKAIDLSDALKMQFKKSEALGASKTLSVSGNLAFTPVVPADPVPAPKACPPKVPDQVITLQASPSCNSCAKPCDSCTKTCYTCPGTATTPATTTPVVAPTAAAPTIKK